MVVGLATITLHLPAADSLKAKRSVVRQLTARVRDRFNVAVAEVDDLDAWQRATLALAAVSTDGAHARGLLQKAVRYVEDLRLDLDLIDYRVELL